jgi:hypothetical protein
MNKQVITLAVKIGMFFAPVLFLAVVYLIWDPFKVLYNYESFYKSGDPLYIILNRDYVSTETFLHNYPTHKYDSFIFGSSCAIFFEVKDWERAIGPKNCFHFDASDESIYGIYKKINYLAVRNITIRNALIVLDEGTLQNTGDSRGHLIMKHPILSGRDRYAFQSEYVKSFFDFDFLEGLLLYKLPDGEKKYKEALFENPPMDYDVRSNEIKFSVFEKMIQTNSEEYYGRHRRAFYRRDTIQHVSGSAIHSEQKWMLNEIFKMLRSAGADYRIVISPLYDQLKFNPEDLDFLMKTFGSERVFDYSGINQLTNDLYNYYETHHYRPHVARWIIDEMYQEARAKSGRK